MVNTEHRNLLYNSIFKAIVTTYSHSFNLCSYHQPDWYSVNATNFIQLFWSIVSIDCLCKPHYDIIETLTIIYFRIMLFSLPPVEFNKPIEWKTFKIPPELNPIENSMFFFYFRFLQLKIMCSLFLFDSVTLAETMLLKTIDSEN